MTTYSIVPHFWLYTVMKFWKGIWKPLAAVGFAATFAASIFHYVGVGPNRAEEEEDNLHEEKDEVRK